MPAPEQPDLGRLLDLHGRVAVVTGGGAGIGAAVVRRLAEAGATVVVADLDVTAAAATAADASAATGSTVVADRVDITDTACVGALLDTVVERFGGVHIAVCNAGIYPTTGPLLDATDEFVGRMVTVNVLGTLTTAREAARRMDHGGVIVTLASTAGFRATPGIGAYTTSKHAVVGLTKALAVELGTRGIRVLGVAPTVIDTPGTRAQATDLAAAGIDLAAAAARNPLGRSGTADEVARVVLFCVSDLAALMTGSTLLADAGTLA